MIAQEGRIEMASLLLNQRVNVNAIDEVIAPNDFLLDYDFIVNLSNL